MTTDNNEVVDETTEETTNGYTDGYVATPKKRSVSTLLALGTYQGMTDEEINSIIDYKVMLAKWDSESVANRATNQAIMEEHIETLDYLCTKTQEVLESVLNSEPQYESVEPITVMDILGDE